MALGSLAAAEVLLYLPGGGREADDARLLTGGAGVRSAYRVRGA